MLLKRTVYAPHPCSIPAGRGKALLGVGLKTRPSPMITGLNFSIHNMISGTQDVLWERL